jgi:hypothetical protein
MKRIIRLTESDLTRIVRRVIRENEWSDKDEMEFQDIRSKGPRLNDFDGDVDLFEPEYEKWQNDPRHVELKNKKRAHRAKQEEDRYSDVVKNRPSDFDVDAYQSEYDELGTKVAGFKKNAPYLKDFEDSDEWERSFKKYKDESNIGDIASRRSELRKHLDRDRKKYGGY